MFSNVLATNNADIAWSIWKSEFLRICQTHAQLKQIKVKSRFNPWFFSKILEAIYQRDKAHTDAIKGKSIDSLDTYRRLRN